jgi:hypothetical protein
MTAQVNPVDQWNDLHEVPQDFFLWTWAKNKYYRSKSGTQDKWNKNHVDMLLFLFTSQANVMSLCLPGCRTVHKMLGPLL